MNLTLLTHTPEPERVVVAAALLCYQHGGPQRAWERAADPERRERVLEELVRAGHGSVLEHAVFTFGIEGVSRVCSHQLVRHRMASYSQQSQRYVDVGDPEYFVKPPSLVDDGGGFEGVVEHAVSYYDEQAAKAEKRGETGEAVREDARYALPGGGKTNLIWTVNLRSLLHIAGVRLCTRAQWEVRELIGLVRDEIAAQWPLIGRHLVPKCDHLGYCDEGKRSCGRRPTREAVAELAERHAAELRDIGGELRGR